MGWVVLIVAVVLLLAVGGWWLANRSSTSGTLTEGSRTQGIRGSDDRAAAGEEAITAPILPPLGGVGVPIVPLLPMPGADDDPDAPPGSSDERRVTEEHDDNP